MFYGPQRTKVADGIKFENHIILRQEIILIIHPGRPNVITGDLKVEEGGRRMRVRKGDVTIEARKGSFS